MNLTTALNCIPDVDGQAGQVEAERGQVAVGVERAHALQAVDGGLHGALLGRLDHLPQDGFHALVLEERQDLKK